MLPRTLRKNTPQGIAVSVAYILPFIVFFAVKDQKTFDWTGVGLLSEYLIPLTSTTWLNILLGSSITILIGVYAQFVFYKYRIFEKGNQFAFVSTIALLSCSTYAGTVAPWTLGALCIVRLMDRSFEIQKSNNPNTIVLEASFTAGILWLIAPEFIWVYPCVLLAYFYSGGVQIKGLIISLFGLLLPFYFISGLNFLSGHPVFIDTSKIIPTYFAPTNPYEFILIGGCASVIVIGIRYLLNAVTANKIIIKNHLVLLLICGVLCVVSSSFSAAGYGDIIVGTFPAFGVLSGLYFANASRIWLMEVTFFLWYSSILLYTYGAL